MVCIFQEGFSVVDNVSWVDQPLTINGSRNDAYGECELYGAHIAQVDFHKTFGRFLKFDIFQIDSLAENFCLLDYAHTAVQKRPICFAIFITRSPHLLVEGPSALLTLSFMPR